MKKCLWMSSAAVVIGALRVKIGFEWLFNPGEMKAKHERIGLFLSESVAKPSFLHWLDTWFK